MTHTSLIQTLFDRILTHACDATIKSYFKDNPGTDIDRDITILTQCYTKSNFKLYFSNFWTTEISTHLNGEVYSIHGKLRLDTKLEWPI